MSLTLPRSPAAAERLAAAQAALAELEAEVGPLSLAAAEGESGAEKKLLALDMRIGTAKRDVQKAEAAHSHAVRLDRETNVAAVESMRQEQMAAFRSAMAARDKEMATCLDAVATLAKAYGRYSEATLNAQISAPAGTAVPVMSTGPSGCYGAAFGPCERLILAELWRLAPERADGAGRFILPIAKAPSILTADRREFSPAIDEFKAATSAILDDIEKQIEKLNAEARARIDERKDAA